MRRPAGMADAGAAGLAVAGELRLEIAQLALGAEAREVAALDDSDAGRVIAAIFEPLQRVHQKRCDFIPTDNADNSAHRLLQTNISGLQPAV